VHDDIFDTWRMGRIMGLILSNDRKNFEYEVHFGGGTADFVSEEHIYVRREGHSTDPIDTLAYRAQETPYFYERRKAVVSNLLKQRAVSHGLTGLLSSRIHLFPHQINVARRILEDQVQRYLLADEVGLGKTIEAGIVLRQAWLDDQAIRILVIVPPSLKRQWTHELSTKFSLTPTSAHLTILTFSEVIALAVNTCFDICVIDEAHHIAEFARFENSSAVWERCREVAQATPRLLLLSATPALHNEQAFLAMLHLLDPANYALYDIAAFHERVRTRQPIGEFLLLFQEDMDAYPLKQCMLQLPLLFPDDPEVSVLAERISMVLAQSDAQSSINATIRAIRVHICETYRIYRRMLRNPREKVGDILHCRANNSAHPQLTVEAVCDERWPGISQLLDAWRDIVLDSLSELDGTTAHETALEQYSRLYLALLSCSSTWLPMLEIAVRCRLGDITRKEEHREEIGSLVDTLTAVPLFPYEEEVLRTLLEVLARPVDCADHIEYAIEVIDNCLNENTQRCVVFTQFTPVAREIAQRLRKALPGVPVYSHLQVMSSDQTYEAVTQFLSEQSSVLVCDASGEEGINLQSAEVMIHIDLPWEPNRLEQRIGRCDRIGREEEVRTRLVVPDDDDRSLSISWVELLRDGFQIFSRSIADLQLYANCFATRLRHVLLLEGTSGAAALTPEIQVDIAKERKVLREQTSLDEIEAYAQEVEDFILPLLAFEEQSAVTQEAIERWVLETLRFDVDTPQGSVYDIAGLRVRGYDGKAQPLLKYEPDDYTLVPEYWHKRLTEAQPTFVTYDRHVAVQHADAELLRIGHPFIEALRDYLNWDDRGQAFAMWRFLPNQRTERNHMIFRLDFAVGASLQTVKKYAASHGLSDEALRAIRRQADAFFPPQYHSIFLRADTLVVLDEEKHKSLLDLLKQPYLAADKGGNDYNLSGERLYALDDIIAPERWRELCREVRRIAEKCIRQDRHFTRNCLTRGQHAKHELAIRQEQLRCGQIYRQGIAAAVGSRTAIIENASGEETAIFTAMTHGIIHPAVRLDSTGVIVLSSANPFSEERQ